MATDWAPEQLERIDTADELRIAARRGDGTLARALPIWAVRVGDAVFVRTWHRRDTGWYGRVLRTGRARVVVPGVEAEVAVEDVRDGPDGLRADVDEAYRVKYGRYGRSTLAAMVSDEAADSTLRLDPEE